MFRHIYLTHYGKSDHTLINNMELAKFMGQSYNPTQQEKYKKYQTHLENEKNKIIISFD